MRLLCALLLVGSVSIVSRAQSPESQNSPDVVVLKASWSKERIGWEGDPFGGPIENFDEMRARARNEKRIDDAKRGGATDVDRIKREAQADSAIVEKVRRKGPPRYKFLYKATIKNTSTRTIKAIDWDYIFFDRVSQSEIGRQQFTSEEKIGPGKTKELSAIFSKPPAQIISVYSFNKNEHDNLTGQVIVVRIEHADGSVWQRP